MFDIAGIGKERPQLHVVSLSGGKDSTAMLLKMIEHHIHFDMVVFNDTGIEFPEMYNHIKLIEERTGINIIRIKPKKSFEYYLFARKVKHKDGSFSNGYGWPNVFCRWCTARLKIEPYRYYMSNLHKKYDIIQYIGFAYDEIYRTKRKNNNKWNFKFPLIEMQLKEKDCLEYCYQKGYTWGGLYDNFERVSCWCCPLQSLSDLRALWKNYPDLWEKLKTMDKNQRQLYKRPYTVQMLEEKFESEV